jgi:hypothetical protein
MLMKKLLIVIALIVILFIAYFIYIYANYAIAPKEEGEGAGAEEFCTDITTGAKLSITEAKDIAIASECGDTLAETYTCNESTGTWWIDSTLKKEGCAPACVVEVGTKIAVINWRCTGAIMKDETDDWQTYTSEEDGVEFKYPENFSANVWRPHFWPPKLTVVSTSEDPVAKGCQDFPSGIQGATENEIKINNINFILYKASEGAAGSSYNSYCYVTEKDQNYYVISFVIKTTNGCGQNCSVYCYTQYEEECLNFDGNKEVEEPISQIISTFKFLED